jgi:hypothetical protein
MPYADDGDGRVTLVRLIPEGEHLARRTRTVAARPARDRKR